jgi:hypothetical protein
MKCDARPKKFPDNTNPFEMMPTLHPQGEKRPSSQQT